MESIRLPIMRGLVDGIVAGQLQATTRSAIADVQQQAIGTSAAVIAIAVGIFAFEPVIKDLLELFLGHAHRG